MAKKMTNAEINAVLTGMIGQSVGWHDSKLARERADILDYYNGKKPKQQHSGSASYVSTDVYDSVEAMKAQLLETFVSGYDVVTFTPRNGDDIRQARIETEYTKYVIYQQNNGYDLFSQTIHDGLIARVGVCKVYWDTTTVSVDEEFSGLSPEEAEGLIAQDEVTDFNAELRPDGYKGKLTRRIEDAQVRIDVIPPEEFLIETDAVSLEATQFCAHRTLKTRSQLIEMGYDPKVVKKLPISTRTLVDFNAETYNRFDPVSTGMGTTAMQDASGKVLFYECFVRLDMNKTGEAKLYKVCKGGEVILDVQEVDRRPFVPFVPLPVPHSFWGNNFAARVVPIQNARTTLMRGILDHTATTINPRWQVLKGGLVNPRELLDNRLGGLVNTTRPDAILPLPQAQLNQFVFPTIEMLDKDREESTGISSLSQGLNKDAVSTQNSQGLVENLVSLSQQRQKIVARNFAYNFLVPLFFEVFRLVIENEDRKKVIQVAGDWVEIDPSTWAERKDVTVNFRLGYGEQEKEAARYVQIGSLINQDPVLQQGFGYEQRYNLASDVFRADGIKNINSYLLPPDKVQPPEPDPKEVADIEHKKAMSQAAMISAQAAAEKAQAAHALAELKAQIDMMQAQINSFKVQSEEKRKDFETVNRIDIAHRELAAAEALPQSEQKGIFSANS